MPKEKKYSEFSKVVTKTEVKKAVPVAEATKNVRNVSLQSWTIPLNGEGYFLTPGASVKVPVSSITQRVINLQKRRLITIS